MYLFNPNKLKTSDIHKNCYRLFNLDLGDFYIGHSVGRLAQKPPMLHVCNNNVL